MKQINAFRLYRSSDRGLIKLTLKKALDTVSCNSLDILLYLNLLYIAKVYVYDIPQKFGRKQYLKKDRVKIPLSYLPCKSKTFIERVLDASDEMKKSIEAEKSRLIETVEEYLSFKQVTTQEIQQILGDPSDLYVKKALENTTRFYYKEED